jgi:small subunit ribosomal protein S1
MSSPATSCASTTTRCWSTSATSPKGSSPPTSSRSARPSTRTTRSTLGEEVDALVLTKEDQDGRLILSKKRARFEKAWRRIEAAAESGEPVEGAVIEVVKGGLIIDLGVRGFLPASLVDIRRVPNLDEYMGTQIECKVIELNRSRNNVVLSRRAVLEEQRKEDRERILDRLQPGLRSSRARSRTSSTSARSSTSTGSTA